MSPGSEMEMDVVVSWTHLKPQTLKYLEGIMRVFYMAYRAYVQVHVHVFNC